MSDPKLESSWESLPVYLTVFLAFAALVFFLGGLLKISPFVTSLLIFLVILRYLWPKRLSFSWPGKRLALPFIFTVIATLLISSSLFGQFFYGGSGLAIHKGNFHDAWWHIAIQESLKISVPPVNPIHFPAVLTGYHYLTDLLLADFSLVTGLPVVELYLKWAPLFFVWLFVATTFALFRRVVTGKIAYFGVLVALFGGSLAFFAPAFFPVSGSDQSLFWLDQPGRYVINQQLLFSLAIFNAIIFFLLEDKRRRWWALSILLGSLFGVKVFGALVIWPLVVIWLAWRGLLAKKPEYFMAIVLSGGIGLIIFLINRGGGDFPFFWAPGWFIQSLMTAPDRLNFPVWEIHRQLFSQTHNYLRLGLLWFGAIGLFLFGNFGLKLLVLALVPAGSAKGRGLSVFLSSVIVISIVLPLFLLQKGVVWNAIQFMHYAQIPLVILLLLATKIKRIAVLSKGLLVFSLITGVFTAGQTVISDLKPGSYQFYSLTTLQSLKAIPESSLVLVGSRLNTTSLVPAVSGRPVYYADPAILSILLINADDRKDYLSGLESGRAPCLPGMYYVGGTEENILVKRCAAASGLLE